MDRIEIYVPAVPVAQPRARATTINGSARMYEAKKSHPIHAFKATVRHAALQAYSGPPLEGPLCLSAVFVFPRPKRLVWKKRDMPREPHDIRPDRDNCDKGLLDALKGLLFVDDAQVCDGSIRKVYAAGDEQPHVLVTIERL